MHKKMLLLLVIQVIFANAINEEELLKHLYTNREYYAKISSQWLFQALGVERIMTKDNEMLYAPYRDSSYESFVQNRELLLEKLPFYSECAMKVPEKAMHSIWDSVSVKGLILSLALDPEKNKEMIRSSLESLENRTAIPVLNANRELLFRVLKTASIPDSSKIYLLSKVTLPDSIKESLLRDTTLSRSNRLRITKDPQLLDSLKSEFLALPQRETLNGKVAYLNVILSSNTDAGFRFAVEVFNDSLSEGGYSGEYSIKYYIIELLGYYYSDELFHKKFTAHISNHHMWELPIQVDLIREYITWFEQNIGASPRIPLEKSLPYIRRYR